MVIIGISQVVATAITKEVTCQLNDVHNYQPGLTRLSRGRAVLEEVPRILPQISYPIEEELCINSHKVWVQDSITKFTPEWSQELMPNKYLS